MARPPGPVVPGGRLAAFCLDCRSYGTPAAPDVIIHLPECIHAPAGPGEHVHRLHDKVLRHSHPGSDELHGYYDHPGDEIGRPRVGDIEPGQVVEIFGGAKVTALEIAPVASARGVPWVCLIYQWGTDVNGDPLRGVWVLPAEQRLPLAT